MKKHIKTEEEFKKFKEGLDNLNSWNFTDISKPEKYPCIVIKHEEHAEYDSYNLYFVYESDFN